MTVRRKARFAFWIRSVVGNAVMFCCFGVRVAPAAVARYAYSPCMLDDTVSIYAVDDEAGILRHNGYALTEKEPVSVKVHPSGRFAYVLNNGSASISGFSIGSSGNLSLDGALTEIQAEPVSDLSEDLLFVNRHE